MVVKEFALPGLGAGVADGELMAWLVEPGERVEEDQPIAEVETDKTMVEIAAPYGGVVSELRAEAGDIVSVGDVIAVFEVDEDESATGATAGDATPEDPTSGPPTTETDAATDPSEGDQPKVAEGRVFAPPRVRRLARERGVDLASVEGSGPGGRITEADIPAALDATTGSGRESEAEPAPRSVAAGEPVVTPAGDDSQGDDEQTPRPRPTDVDRGTPAITRADSADASSPDAVTASEPDRPEPPAEPATAGHHTVHHDEADVTDLLALRERLSDDLLAGGTDLSALPFAIAALVAAVEHVPGLIDSDSEGTDAAPPVNVAVGVPTDDGLRRPVIIDADEAGIRALADELADLVARARADDLAPAETADATITVTDFGALGGTYTTPDVAAAGTPVVALGAIRRLPRVQQEAVVPRDVVALSTAVDTRTTDEATAAQFTNELRRYLTAPELLLL